MRLPRLFGKAVFYTSATLDTDGRAGRYNIADLINDFTLDLRRSLTPSQEAELTTQFTVAFEGIQWLEQHQPDSLFKLSLANLEASVEAATRRRNDFGLSKWESLQAIEKILKGAIRTVGGKPSNIHKLHILQQEAAALGLLFDIGVQLDAIQCTPGIRYGDEKCDKIDALEAHHAVLQAIWLIKAVMEKRAL